MTKGELERISDMSWDDIVEELVAQNAEIAELKKEVARLIEINAFLSAGKINLCREEIEQKDARIAELEKTLFDARQAILKEEPEAFPIQIQPDGSASI